MYVSQMNKNDKQELQNLLKELFINDGLSGAELESAMENAMDSKVQDLFDENVKGTRIAEILEKY